MLEKRARAHANTAAVSMSKSMSSPLLLASRPPPQNPLLSLHARHYKAEKLLTQSMKRIASVNAQQNKNNQFIQPKLQQILQKHHALYTQQQKNNKTAEYEQDRQDMAHEANESMMAFHAGNGNHPVVDEDLDHSIQELLNQRIQTQIFEDYVIIDGQHVLVTVDEIIEPIVQTLTEQDQTDQITATNTHTNTAAGANHTQILQPNRSHSSSPTRSSNIDQISSMSDPLSHTGSLHYFLFHTYNNDSDEHDDICIDYNHICRLYEVQYHDNKDILQASYRRDLAILLLPRLKFNTGGLWFYPIRKMTKNIKNIELLNSLTSDTSLQQQQTHEADTQAEDEYEQDYDDFTDIHHHSWQADTNTITQHSTIQDQTLHNTYTTNHTSSHSLPTTPLLTKHHKGSDDGGYNSNDLNSKAHSSRHNVETKNKKTHRLAALQPLHKRSDHTEEKQQDHPTLSSQSFKKRTERSLEVRNKQAEKQANVRTLTPLTSHLSQNNLNNNTLHTQTLSAAHQFLANGSRFNMYTYDQQHRVTESSIILWYVPAPSTPTNMSSLGSLYWCDSSSPIVDLRLTDPTHCLPLRSLTDVFTGRHAKIFDDTPAANTITDSTCFSLVGTKTELHLASKNESARNAWLSALKEVLTGTDSTVIEEEEVLDELDEDQYNQQQIQLQGQSQSETQEALTDPQVKLELRPATHNIQAIRPKPVSTRTKNMDIDKALGIHINDVTAL